MAKEVYDVHFFPGPFHVSEVVALDMIRGTMRFKGHISDCDYSLPQRAHMFVNNQKYQVEIIEKWVGSGYATSSFSQESTVTANKKVSFCPTHIIDIRFTILDDLSRPTVLCRQEKKK